MHHPDPRVVNARWSDNFDLATIQNEFAVASGGAT